MQTLFAPLQDLTANGSVEAGSQQPYLGEVVSRLQVRPLDVAVVLSSVLYSGLPNVGAHVVYCIEHHFMSTHKSMNTATR